jgi:spermidine/putrescine ABC transporter ATP-binding subunit
VTKVYDATVVKGIDLDIAAGEFLTLLGPSGSGKSTTLMIIAGFVIPSAGDVIVNGHSIVALPPFKRDLGIVFQNYSLFPHMDVFQNVAFPLEMRSVPKREIAKRVRAALELVRLPDIEHRRTHQLSGGQQQRLALARALVFRPAVLLLDEPLGALDLKLRHELQIEIKRVHDELGITVIYVTHDQGEALSMSDRIVVMDRGSVQQVGKPSELYRAPANAFVANFVGEVNSFTGAIAQADHTSCVISCADGINVRGSALHAPQGRRLTMIVRPESVVPLKDAECDANAFDGVVEEITFLGEVSKYRIRLGPTTIIRASWQNRSTFPKIARGQSVRVGWSADDMTVITDAPR